MAQCSYQKNIGTIDFSCGTCLIRTRTLDQFDQKNHLKVKNIKSLPLKCKFNHISENQFRVKNSSDYCCNHFSNDEESPPSTNVHINLQNDQHTPPNSKPFKVLSYNCQSCRETASDIQDIILNEKN